MAKKAEVVKVEKVQPYPIATLVSRVEAAGNHPPIDGETIRVEDFGVLFKTKARFFKLGDYYMVNFEIPVLKIQVIEEVRVVKTKESYETLVPGTAQEKVVTVEFHFKGLSEESKKAIRNFTFRIGQKRAA